MRGLGGLGKAIHLVPACLTNRNPASLRIDQIGPLSHGNERCHGTEQFATRASPWPSASLLQIAISAAVEVFAQSSGSAQCCISFLRDPKSASGPSPMSNFGRAARRPTSIRSGLGWCPRHRSCVTSARFPSSGIAKFAAIV